MIARTVVGGRSGSLSIYVIDGPHDFLSLKVANDAHTAVAAPPGSSKQCDENNRCGCAYEGCSGESRDSRHRAPLKPKVGLGCMYVCRLSIPATVNVGGCLGQILP